MNEGRHGQAMGGAGAPQRFVLARVDARHWVIHDRRSGTAGDRVAARLSVSDDDEVHVTWLSVTPLPIVYATPGDVLTSLEMWQSRPHGGTKPIPIPHFPPAKRNSAS